ncbi:hypothetical protein GGX14DRAFT_654096 [Mycena pura]|uniref:Acetyl-CoA synthetase-like protein n=1 Tax=Mycena pura TaxID=153505 RepID=A0AAD6V6M0_9AGAR|nr:hypothetical protein GGX14DRAFT_654096 [Mycena pura]
MSFRTFHGLSSPTFKPPPLDGSLLFPDVFEYQFERSSNHPLFLYADADGRLETLLWSDAVRAFRRAAHISRERIRGANAGTAPPVVAILAVTVQVQRSQETPPNLNRTELAHHYGNLTIIAGLMLAGYIPFPISPRNSDAAVADLLQSTACRHSYVSSDSGMQKLAAAAKARIFAQGFGELEIWPLPRFQELFVASNIPDTRLIGASVKMEDVAIIMHSSGSTTFPKAIRLTHRILLEMGLIPYYGEVDFCGLTTSAHAAPVFHMLGLTHLPYAAFTGMSIAAFSPSQPPVPPSPDRVFDLAITTKASMLTCPPSFLETWAQNPIRVQLMKSFVSFIFGGGPLQRTPSCCVAALNVIAVVSSHIDPVLVPIDDDSDVFRVFLKTTHTPAILNAVIDGVPALDTKDLVQRHPEDHRFWKIYGRHDDQIIHSNGEKTNPVPIEKIILEDPAVKHVVLFGRGNFHVGAIVFPETPFDPTDTERSIEFRRKIWRVGFNAPQLATDHSFCRPAVEAANRIAPTHSRIFKEMILVASPDKPLQLTVKGTPRRGATLQAYAEEIRELYQDVDQSFQKHLPRPKQFNNTTSLDFVRQLVGDVMVELPRDDDDLFRHGCDSLQATWIRNSIIHAVTSSSGIDYQAIPNNFVYSHPTIRQLAQMLTKLSTVGTTENENGAIHAITGDETLRAHCRDLQRAWHAAEAQFGECRSRMRPLDSLEGLTVFWRDEIRRKQPHGPYRIAAFSASALMGVVLAKMLKVIGEAVEQLTFIDNGPALWLREDAEMQLREKTVAQLRDLTDRAVENMLRADPAIPPEALASNPNLRGFGSVGLGDKSVRISAMFMTVLYRFLNNFYPDAGEKSYGAFAGSFSAWLNSIDVACAVVVAEHGLVKFNMGGAWLDLGASYLGPLATAHVLDGVGHWGIFSDERLARNILGV